MPETSLLSISLTAVAVLLAVVLYALHRAARRSEEERLEAAIDEEDFDRAVPLLVGTARSSAHPVRREASMFDDAARRPHAATPIDEAPPFPRQAPSLVVPSANGDAVERGSFIAPAELPPPPAAEPARRPAVARAPRPAAPAPRVPREDGTLRLLPGRFEVIASCDGLPAELRFVSVTPSEATVITFGRVPGEAYRHVQLPVPTVSREHARLVYDEGYWRLTNLSATNPTLVNGAPLPAHGGEHVLRDGDRIEMGEVVFRFRAG
jgi:hypothetical protein